jgi:anthranilate phosphoribosyltransferase
MIKEALTKLTQGQDLNFEETKEVFNALFEHKMTSAQTAAILTALAMKGETEEEIFAAATVVRQKAHKLSVRGSFLGIETEDEQIFDPCGTGGSSVNKFNISTAVAFIIASAGVKVAKHGNRAMSSNCGSADVLEELGIKIDANPSLMQEAISKTGIGFLYAPLYHPALKEVAQVRRELCVKTIFNILGPLCNPAFATHQVLGVYKKELVTPLANVLKKLGTRKALVVYGKDIKDEVSLSGQTFAAYLSNQKIKSLILSPADFGLKKIKAADIEVKDVKESAKTILDIFDAKPGPRRDIVLANAACCLYVAGRAQNLKEATVLAGRLVDEGKTKNKFEEFRNFIKGKTNA